MTTVSKSRAPDALAAAAVDLAKDALLEVLDVDEVGEHVGVVSEGDRVVTADGKQLASSGDYNGRDPFLAFAAPSDGEYLIRVFDLSYRGGFPYRLLITDKPYITSLSQRIIQSGMTADLIAIGHNFGSASVA